MIIRKRTTKTLEASPLSRSTFARLILQEIKLHHYIMNYIKTTSSNLLVIIALSRKDVMM